MIKLERIDFTYWEGRHHFQSVYRTWAEANEAISREGWSAPDDGSYDKIDIKITWEDGTTLKHRFDLQHKHWGSSMALSREIIRFNMFYAGRHRPSTIPESTYKEILSWARPEEHAELLDNYDLGRAI